MVVVAMDTVRWDHTSLAGYERDTTPNLARLAASSGARDFTRAYSGASWSLPSYATVLTGRDVYTHGVGFVRGAMNRSHASMPQVMGAYGYRTAAFTSGPHLDWSTGLGQGFEVYEHSVSMASLGRAVDQSLDWLRDGAGADTPFFLFVQGYDAHPPIVVPAAYSEAFDPGYDGRVHDVSGISSPRLARMPPTRSAAWLKMVATLERVAEQEDALAEGALLIEHGFALARLQGGPRIAIPEGDDRSALSTLARAHGIEGPPPAPGGASPADLAASVEHLAALGLGDALVSTPDGPAIDPALTVRVLGDEFSLTQADIDHYVAHYDAGVLTADYHLGRLLHGLEASGVLDHTIVVALSDHGERLGETGQIGHDTEFGDAVFHVPLVVRMPDGSPASKWEGVVSLADLLPSLADALAFSPPQGMSGQSFVDVLGAKPPAVDPDAAALEASMCCFAVRSAAWELRAARDPAPLGGGLPGFGRPQTSDAAAWGDWRWELYADGGGPDVSSAHPDVVAALSPRLDPWFAAAERVRARNERRKNISHGNVQDRPDLVEALKEGGYWKPGDAPATSGDEVGTESGAEPPREER